MNTNTQHTPGPWHFGEGHDGVTRKLAGVGSTSGPICTMEWCAEMIPNARLASAAPELLEALKVCERNLANNIENLRISNFGDDKLLAQCRAAIAKAEGR